MDDDWGVSVEHYWFKQRKYEENLRIARILEIIERVAREGASGFKEKPKLRLIQGGRK